MYVEASDFKPPTILSGRPFDLAGFLFGAVVTLITHLGLPALILLVLFLLHAIGAIHDTARAPLRDEHVVAARFVKLGHPFDPRRLPNRRVPHLSTAPDHRVVVSKNLNAVQHDEPDSGRPPQAVLDRIARIGDRAQVFAEIAEQREQEGDPNGVQEGEANAQEGDVYLGQFVHYFHAGWSTPDTIPSDVLFTLNAVAGVELTADGHIASFEIARSSGDPDFDQTVMAQIQRLKDSGDPIPQPPAAVADQYYGRSRNLRYNGRDAH